ncbi:MAG TPA: hypothetical protein VH186_18180 [Chloroflexia bacterium]|nr:hypothetical protein [Chloroflexia bacterium]
MQTLEDRPVELETLTSGTNSAVAAPSSKKVPVKRYSSLPYALLGVTLTLLIIGSLGYVFLSAGSKIKPLSDEVTRLKSVEIGKSFDASKNAVDKAITFKPQDKIFYLAQFENPQKGVKVRISLTRLGENGSIEEVYNNNVFLASQNETQLSGSIAPYTKWENGNYKLNLYLEGKPERTINYTVQ